MPRAVCIVACLLALASVSVSCGPRKVPRRAARPGDFVTLTLGSRSLRAELVFDDPSRTRGLMFREKMPEDQGMLFLHPRKKRLSFWMKDTPLPLSIAFLDDDGKILQIEDMKPNDTSHTVSKKEVRYALEVHQGWFRRAEVGVGDTIPGFRAKVRGIPVR